MKDALRSGRSVAIAPRPSASDALRSAHLSCSFCAKNFKKNVKDDAVFGQILTKFNSTFSHKGVSCYTHRLRASQIFVWLKSFPLHSHFEVHWRLKKSTEQATPPISHWTGHTGQVSKQHLDVYYHRRGAFTIPPAPDVL